MYIGQTNNLKDRIYRHNAGKVRSTKHRRPLIVIYREAFGSRKEAIRKELYLKSLKGDLERKIDIKL